ncbi:unnamed protein product [Closterium sp. Yama58-4]|nr:unnamed protein product [Closterium sp. Yama58-4]
MIPFASSRPPFSSSFLSHTPHPPSLITPISSSLPPPLPSSPSRLSHPRRRASHVHHCPTHAVRMGGDPPAPFRLQPCLSLTVVIHNAAAAATDPPPLCSPPFHTPSTKFSADAPISSSPPGDVHRTFITVPHGSAWAEIHLHLSAFTVPLTVVIHTLQLLPARRPTYRRTRAFYQFTAPSSKSLSILVEGGGTLEVAVGLNCCQVDFHGLTPVHGDVTINGGSNVQRIDITSAPFRMERFTPTVSLNRVRSAYRPSEAKVEPLSSPETCFRMAGKSRRSISQSGRYTPRLPLLNQRLYDSEVEGQFFQLFDSHRRLLACEDAYPKPVKLGKGEFTVKLQIRGDQVGRLEKLKTMPLLLDRTLDDKDATPGTLLLGRMTLAKTGGLFVNTDANAAAPCRVHVTYVVPPPNKSDDKKSSSSSGSAPPTKTTAERMQEELRDAKVKVLAAVAAEERDKAKGEGEFVALVQQLKEEYPNHLPLLLEVLRFYDDPKMRPTSLLKVVEAADAVVASIDRTALAVFLAMKCEPEGPNAQAEKKEKEAQRDALVEALHKKALALGDLQSPFSAAPSAFLSCSHALPSHLSHRSDFRVDSKVYPSLRSFSSLSSFPIHPLLSLSFSPCTHLHWPRSQPPQPSSESPAAAGIPETSSLTATEAAPAPPSPADAPSAAAPAALDPGGGGGNGDVFEETYAELRKWADVSQSKYGMLGIMRERRANRPALALKNLNKVLEDDPKQADKKMHELRILNKVLEDDPKQADKKMHELKASRLAIPHASLFPSPPPLLSCILNKVLEDDPKQADKKMHELRILNKVLEDDPKQADKKMHELKVTLLQQLQWPLWAVHEKRWNTARFPTHWAPF